MPDRTTAVAVKELLGRNYDSSYNPPLTRHIKWANKVVDRVVTCATQKGETLDTAELEMLECLLAAHHYQASDEGYTSRSTSGASGSFKGQFGKGLERTTYGQDAMLMDATGCLTAFDKGNKATFLWGGKPEPEQLSYRERN